MFTDHGRHFCQWQYFTSNVTFPQLLTCEQTITNTQGKTDNSVMGKITNKSSHFAKVFQA